MEEDFASVLILAVLAFEVVFIGAAALLAAAGVQVRQGGYMGSRRILYWRFDLQR